ncbi:hypothetical protein K440DRAFT_644719 [Wilcoxina mikolae CBS 423.85]|nr:hypothetical protein K440DRAFT_644719 [Wilcoxina mikolae CBS 423.85]
MSDPNTLEPAPQRWFALIGIDFYMSGEARYDEHNSPIFFPSLRGCISDVIQVRDYIESKFKADARIMMLTSTNPMDGRNEPPEDPRHWPTFDNIVGLLERITCEAQKGDLVHIHYSGHGARVYRRKGELPLKAIVPFDMACGGSYILDVKIIDLVDAMVMRGLIVTVVLDCCHSGSTARDSSPGLSNYRGISQIDATEFAAIDATKSQATVIGESQHRPTTADSNEPASGRGGQRTAKSWEQRGCEILAACRVNEKAYEACYENGKWHGVLTYHLLDSLKTGGANLTHGMLYRRLVPLVNNKFESQMPVFKGDGQRFFFSHKRLDGPIPTCTVMRLDGPGLILNIGAAIGMTVGSELGIYPWDASDFSRSSRCARVRITEVSEMESKAELIGKPATDVQIKPGFQAMASKFQVSQLAVKFSRGSKTTEGGKFDQLQDEISSGNPHDDYEKPGSSVRLVSDPNDAAYHIGVNNHHYQLLNRDDQLIRHFPTSTAVKCFVRHLRHLAQFEMSRNLKNSNPPEFKFHFGLLARESVSSSTNGRYYLEDGTSAYLEFKNQSDQPLNLTIFHLGTSWCVRKIFPADSDFYTIEPGHSAPFHRKMDFYLPKNWDSSLTAVDIFKAYITTGTTSLRPLELPELGPEETTLERGSPQASIELENFFDALDALDVSNTSDPHERYFRFGCLSDWVTSQFEVHTTPKKIDVHVDLRIPGSWPGSA